MDTRLTSRIDFKGDDKVNVVFLGTVLGESHHTFTSLKVRENIIMENDKLETYMRESLIENHKRDRKSQYE